MLLALILSGCAVAVPVKQRWPDAPKSLLRPCSELKPAKPDAKLSELLITVELNYQSHHECRDKVEGWQEWYKTQQDIWNSVNK